MARTRIPLQLDDLNDGDLVEFDRGQGHRSRGIYRGLYRGNPVSWWMIRLEQPNGASFSFLARSAKSVRILKFAEKE